MDISKARCTGCGQPMKIVRVRCDACNVSMDGDFEASPLARLSSEDQALVMAFLRHHGSIKKMESLFSISYPTVKNRLNAINAQLDQSFAAPSLNADVLDQLARGEITVDEALERLS
jgi:hypothetical protein